MEVLAIGDGLCVNNLFQSNMVIQRDKPVRVWGWASAGEKVTVSFAGQTKTVEAGRSRSWQAELTAMEAIFKDGKEHGPVTGWYGWYKNGQKSYEYETTRKAGKILSSKKWDEDGNPK